MKECSSASNDCNPNQTSFRRGLCGYHRYRLGLKAPDAPKAWSRRNGKHCEADGCELTSVRVGLCPEHARAYDAARNSKRGKRLCTYRDCGRPLAHGRLCGTHYNMQVRGEALRPIVGMTECPIPGCDLKMREDREFCDKHRRVLKRYTLTVEQMMTLWLNPRCGNAVCSNTRNLHVDHDHACCPEPGKSCGKCVRGLLCHKCNVALGQVNDDRGLLLGLIDYLGR